jgi:hypothetical protein
LLTLGNIAVFCPTILGSFPDKRGVDAILPCDSVNAGKYRNGASRWWCCTHQAHWGTTADQASFEQYNRMVCANGEKKVVDRDFDAMVMLSSHKAKLSEIPT